MRVIIWLYSLKRFLKGSRYVGNLSVRQNLAGLYRISVTDLPRRDPDHAGQFVQDGLKGEFCLAYAKTSKRS